MIDLSYTDKDGLNPAAGFTNIFNYHRDGAAEGDGYEHGGYPEITGETSELPDTSYKTGDNPDFWGNGNVWVQPSVNPGPGPELGLSATILPVISPGSVPDLADFIVSGSLPVLVEGDTYTVIYNGVTYNNVPVTAITATYPPFDPSEPPEITNYISLGNSAIFFNRGGEGDLLLRNGAISALPEDNGLPFDITIAKRSPDEEDYSPEFISTELVTQELTIISSNGDSCTLSFNPESMWFYGMQECCINQNYEETVNMFNITDGSPQSISINDTVYETAWEASPEGFVINVPLKGEEGVSVELDSTINIARFSVYNTDEHIAREIKVLPAENN